MLIKGKTLGNIKLKTIVYENDSFEIYKTILNDNVLIVKKVLYDKWI